MVIVAIFNLFKKEQKVSLDTVNRDIDALVSMASEIRFTNNRYGTAYWYYFINDVTDTAKIRRLFARNGVKPEYHLTACYRLETPVFRIRNFNLLFQPKARKFVEQLQDAYDKKYDLGYNCKVLPREKRTR